MDWDLGMKWGSVIEDWLDRENRALADRELPFKKKAPIGRGSRRIGAIKRSLVTKVGGNAS